MKRFFAELRRRKVVRVAIVYIIAAWIVVEAASVVLPGLLLPEWSERLVLALAILGFPLALVLAWALELTPEGVQREKPGPADEHPSDMASALAAAAARDAAAIPASMAAAASAATEVTAPARTRAVRADERRAIAVLPLANMSGDPENEFFSDGISEEILNRLARQPGLRVVSRTSSFSFKNTTLDIPAIAAKLGVDIVLEGSVRRAGNRVRITAQLIDAANDAHLWSNTYDRELENIFAVQTEIAKCIVSAMDLTPDECLECQGNTDDVDAYEFYLRGRQYFHQHLNSSLTFSLQMFSKAIDIDPTFARAYAGLADAHSLMAQWIDRSPEHLRGADEASEKALELAPMLPEAHASRGFALSLNGDYAGAAGCFDQALEIDPHHYDSLYLYGRSRFAEGNLDHAVELWTRAHEAQPDEFQSASLRTLALTAAGRLDEAHESNRQAVTLIEGRLALNPDDLRALGLGAGALIIAGRREEGLAMADRGLKLAPNDEGVIHNAACAYANAGDVERALELLQRRMDLTGTVYRDWIEHDSDFDSLRDDPRFIALMEKIPRFPGGATPA